MRLRATTSRPSASSGTSKMTRMASWARREAGSRCACPSARTATRPTGTPPTASSGPSKSSAARSVVPGGWMSSPASRLLPSSPGSTTSVSSPSPARAAATAAPAMPPPATTTSKSYAWLTSIDSGHDSPSDFTAIRVPVRAVLRLTDGVIAALAVDEQHDHVDEVKIWQGVLEPRRQAPREGHGEVAEIVQMAGDAPPAGRQQQRAGGGPDVRGRPAPHRPRGIAAEAMLLDVRGAEHSVTRHVEDDDAGRRRRRQRVHMVYEVIGLDRVREGHPHKVAPREHPAEFLVLDIPRSEDRLLVEEIVGDVQKLERGDQQHGRRHRAMPLVLRAGERQIEEDPEDQTGAALAEVLEVESAHARVERRAHEVVADRVSRRRAGAASLHVETEREGAGHEVGGGEQRPELVEDHAGGDHAADDGGEDDGQRDPERDAAVQSVAQA